MTQKLKLFIDADDTIMESTQAVVRILNKKYNLNKNTEDSTDWGFQSIKPGITGVEVENIFASDEFFSEQEVNNKFLKFFNSNIQNFDWLCVTKGNDQNISNKHKYFKSHFGDVFTVYGSPCYPDYTRKLDYDKSHINMRHGIQIDDRMDCLETTNASVKILITNGRKRDWNRPTVNVENLYIAKDWDEVAQIITFFNNNREFLN